MCDQDRPTAFHEAGHSVALEERGVRVTSIVVNPDGEGTTSFPLEEFRALSDDDAVLVGLAGIQAESHFADNDGFRAAVDAYVGASRDRDQIAERLRTVWLAPHVGSLWHQGIYNRAAAFVDRNNAHILAIANALLAQPNYPKTLTGDAARHLMGR